MKIEYKTVNPLDLSLDFENPRFLKPLRDEPEVRLYLIEYEDSLEVANSIAEHGMLPGDSIVCVIEDGETVVIEGNRRVSVMQMLLERDLIPPGFEEAVPEVDADILGELERVNVQIIENRDLALAVMANRHIAGIKQWKPLAKRKFFSSRFDTGMSIDQLSAATNISKGEIEKDITEYKFVLENYERYVAENPGFSEEFIDLKIDRFVRVFTTKTDHCGVKIGAKEYLMMERDEDLNTTSSLPRKLFTEFTQHVFEKAFDPKGGDSVDTRTAFDEIPGIEKWKLTIDKERGRILSSSSPPATDAQDEKKPTGGPSPPKFMGALHWAGKLIPDNPDHKALYKTVAELYSMSTGRGKGYVRFPIAAAMLARSAYEQALKLLIKSAGFWDGFESEYNNPRDQTLSVMERYVERNLNDISEKGTPMREAFMNIKRGHYREFLNDCTHNLDYAYPSKDKLEAFAGEGLEGFLQGVIDYVSNT